MDLCFVRANHLFWLDPFIKLLRCQKLTLYCSLFQRQSLLMRCFGNNRRLIISNIRIQSSNKHQTSMQKFVNVLHIGFYTNDTIICKTLASVSSKPCRVQKIGRHDRLEYIQLKVSLTSSNTDCHIISHDLSTYHGDCLTLRWIYFTRHDTRSWLILWQRNLPKTTSWSTSQKPNIIGNLVQTASNDIQSSRHFHNGIMSSQRLEFVGSCNKWKFGFLLNLCSNCLIVSLQCI
mmetsp:Transcript_11574/g.21641  ORF Transcript_11574/g.21641 Transcript_11574/m.21641 type:complete len:233 (+) Transcript_11574:78-776(+)